MGSWFGTLLKENGYQVMISDKNRRAGNTIARKKGFKFVDRLDRSIQSVRLLVFATPTQITSQILSRLTTKLPSGILLVEMSSIKEPIRSTLQRLGKLRVPILSIHPMFGPGTRSLRGRTVLATSIPKRNAQATKILSIFQRKGARIIRCTIKEHDYLMSALLTLPHFLNVAMVKALRVNRFRSKRLRALSGTTFSLQSLIAEVMHQESPDNVTSILMDARNSPDILEEYVRQCNEIIKSVRRGNRRRIVDALNSNRAYLARDGGFRKAYWNFNAAVASLR